MQFKNSGWILGELVERRKAWFFIHLQVLSLQDSLFIYLQTLAPKLNLLHELTQNFPLQNESQYLPNREYSSCP